MLKPRILLLDFAPQTSFGCGLQEILASSIESEIVHQLEPDASIVDETVSRFHPSMIFWISPIGSENAVELIPRVTKRVPGVPNIAIIDSSEPMEVVALLNCGIYDFVSLPLRKMDIVPRTLRCLDHGTTSARVSQTIKGELGLRQLVGASSVFTREIRKIPLIANCDYSVFISGETGTGKELYARAIHYTSPRAHRPFIPVNSGAIPAELVESELFGHEKGSFTSASAKHVGLIAEADGGTLFLDEIDSLPLGAQVKLLRFLQEKEFRPVGSSKIHHADVRIIAAANADPDNAVEKGILRRDLYYRLNVIPIDLPALRERLEDIPALARHFLAKHAHQLGRNLKDFSQDAMEALIRYSWPGNVRELEHVVERAMVFCSESIIQVSDIFLPRAGRNQVQKSFRELKSQMIADFEKNYIRGLLALNDGNITRAAHAAQKNRRAFWALIRKHRIDMRSFRSNV
jgi:DNA-binding NtrC family response regulator